MKWCHNCKHVFVKVARTMGPGSVGCGMALAPIKRPWNASQCPDYSESAEASFHPVWDRKGTA